VWRICRAEGYYDTRCLKGLWSSQDKAGGIVLKAAWQWVVIAVS